MSPNRLRRRISKETTPFLSKMLKQNSRENKALLNTIKRDSSGKSDLSNFSSEDGGVSESIHSLNQGSINVRRVTSSVQFNRNISNDMIRRN